MEHQQPPQALPRPAMEPNQHVIAPENAEGGATPVQQQPTPSVQPSASPQVTPQQYSAQGAAAQPLPVDNPAIADDSDLIEKEWVVRAKQIVSSTHNDPYQQNRSIMRLRADYLKKRYNKDLDMGKA